MQVVLGGTMIAPLEVAMIGQVLVDRDGTIEQTRVDRPVAATTGQVRVGQAVGVRFEIATIARVRVVRVEITIVRRVFVTTVQVLVDRRGVEMTVQVRAIHGGTAIARRGFAMIDPVPVGQVRVGQVRVDRSVIATIAPRGVAMTDRVPVGQVRGGRIATAMIAGMFQLVRKPRRSEKQMKYIIAPVVASTARYRCPLPNTPPNVGVMTVQ